MSGIDDKVYNRILLFVLGIPVFFLLLFTVVSMIQLREINSRIEEGQSQTVKEMIARNPHGDSISEVHRQFLALAVLEEESLGERYRQGHYSLVSRSFKQFLGFFTGIIMVIVGCVFILLKLREEINASGSQGEQLKFALITTSPGVVFGIVGAVLIGITSTTNDKITVRDSGLYLTREYLVAPFFGAKGYQLDPGEFMTDDQEDETPRDRDTLRLQSPPSKKDQDSEKLPAGENPDTKKELIIQRPPKK